MTKVAVIIQAVKNQQALKFLTGFILMLVSATVFAEQASNDVASQAAEGGFTTSGALGQGLMLAAFAFIFYFLILRPQSKRAKEHKTLISGLQKGDEVITAGGILGKIVRGTDEFFVLSISEGTEIIVQRQAIAGNLPKGTMKSI